MKSMTAEHSLIPLRSGEEIWVSLPAERGTYYLSKFGAVAI
jgi:hypothetical protein